MSLMGEKLYTVEVRHIQYILILCMHLWENAPKDSTRVPFKIKFQLKNYQRICQLEQIFCFCFSSGLVNGTASRKTESSKGLKCIMNFTSFISWLRSSFSNQELHSTKQFCVCKFSQLNTIAINTSEPLLSFVCVVKVKVCKIFS